METLISSPGVEQEQGERQWWCPTRCRWTCTTMTAPDRSGTLPIFAPASSSPSTRSTSPLCPVVPTPGSYVLMANIHGRASPTSIFSPSELTNFSPSTLHKDYLQREVKWDFFFELSHYAVVCCRWSSWWPQHAMCAYVVHHPFPSISTLHALPIFRPQTAATVGLVWMNSYVAQSTCVLMDWDETRVCLV